MEAIEVQNDMDLWEAPERKFFHVDVPATDSVESDYLFWRERTV